MSKQKDLGLLLHELRELKQSGAKATASGKTESWFLSAISCVKDGSMTLADLDREQFNERSARYGLPGIAAPVVEHSSPGRRDAEVWQEFCRTGVLPELRDSTVGNGKPEYFQGNLGSFVPRSFFAGVKASMKWYDPLLDPDVCTVLETESGAPVQFPYMSSVESIAQTVTTENSDQSTNELDPASTGEVDLTAWSYRTPMWRLSVEALNDVQQMTSVIDVFKTFSASRVARGVGKDLMTGNGVGKPLGLIPSLQLLATQAGTVCIGSSETTGGAQTGSNSVGITDVTSLYFSVDQSYRQSPKCAWLMNDNTRLTLSATISKQGEAVWRVANGKDYLFGKPIYTAPSMANIGNGNIPICFGDLSYWVSRHATAGDRVQLLKEFSGGIEKGEVGLRCWQRWDGALLYSSANGTCPIKFLVTHS